MTETRNVDLSAKEVSRVLFSNKRRCLIRNLSGGLMRSAADESTQDEDSISEPPQRLVIPSHHPAHLPNVCGAESVVLDHDYAQKAMASSASNYNGWLETSKLMAVAARYGRTASQFRVLHAVSDVRDSITKMKIPQNTLIVQSRFVSPSGNRGGQTFAFLHWRLPGNKAKCRSMYKDTRPSFHHAGTPIDAYPSMSLDDNLHPVVKTLVTTFVQEAEVGMTPITFFGRGNGPEIFFLSYNFRDLPTKKVTSFEIRKVAHSIEKPITIEHHNNVAKTSDSAQHTVIPLLHNAKESPKTELSNNYGRPDLAHVQNRDLGNNEVDESSSIFDVTDISFDRRSSKRSRLQTFSGRTPKSAKKRRFYGGSKRQDLLKAVFNVDDSISNKFLVLVEGIVESTDSTLVASHDYLREIFLDGRVESMPCRGRLVELLPNSALSGTWLATTIGADGDEKRSSGFIRNSIQDLRGMRIVLRHEQFATLGLLSRDTSMTMDSDSSNHQIHVSRIDPSISRKANFQSQCVIGDDHDPLIVGSISIAACEGCTSWSDANSAIAGKLASDLLVASRTRMLELSRNGLCSSEDLETLLPIPARTSMAKGPTNIGVSFLCNFTSKESYSILAGQNEEGRVVAVDVVLELLDCRYLSSDCSGSSLGNPKLNAENIRQFVHESHGRMYSATSVVSSGQVGVKDSESEDFVTIMKCGAEMPVALTPTVPTIRMDLSETFQSLLSPSDPIHSKLTLITPLTGCVQNGSEPSAHILNQSEHICGLAIWPSCEAADCEDCVDTQLDFGSPIKHSEANKSARLVVAEDESGSSKIVLDKIGPPRHVTTPRFNFYRKTWLVLSFMAFCLKIPENLPEPVQYLGHNLAVQRRPIFDDWPNDAKIFAQPIGYAIAGIDLVSIASITFILAIFCGL